MVNFNGFIPWSDSEIKSFESNYETRLPGDVKDFLIAVGSGYFQPSLAVPHMEGRGILESILSCAEARMVRSSEGGYSDVIPSEYLVIGYGAGGAICVGLNESVRGGAYWADYDAAEEMGLYHETTPPRSHEIMVKLSESWGDLLKDLPHWDEV